MKYSFQRILCVTACAFSLNAFAESIKVGSGLALPPYILEKGKSGMEIEVVKAALNDFGNDIESVKLFPFARVATEINKRNVNAVFPVREETVNGDVYFSDSHMTYQNVVVTHDGVKIENLKDLTKYSVKAFQNAKLYLGDDFKNIVSTANRYSEMADQRNQVKIFFKKRVESIVIDINIFKYFYNDLVKAGEISKDVNYVINDNIFSPTEYKVAFSNEDMKNKFNSSLDKIRKNGTYNKIIEKYVGKSN